MNANKILYYCSAAIVGLGFGFVLKYYIDRHIDRIKKEDIQKETTPTEKDATAENPFGPPVVFPEQSPSTLPEEIYSLAYSTLGCTDLHMSGLGPRESGSIEVTADNEARYVKRLEEEKLISTKEVYEGAKKLCGEQTYLLVFPEDDSSVFYVSFKKDGKNVIATGHRSEDKDIAEFVTANGFPKGDTYSMDHNDDRRVDFFLYQDSNDGTCTGAFIDKTLFAFFMADPERVNPKAINFSIPQNAFTRTLESITSDIPKDIQCDKPVTY